MLVAIDVCVCKHINNLILPLYNFLSTACGVSSHRW